MTNTNTLLITESSWDIQWYEVEWLEDSVSLEEIEQIEADAELDAYYAAVEAADPWWAALDREVTELEIAA